MPLVTVMLALFSAFPMFATLQDALQRYFLQTLVPDSIARPVMGAITQFSIRASRLGIVGLVALVVSALAMMLTIDRALNAIWRVASRGRIAQRVLVYWAAVTLGPLIFAVSLTATSYAVSASRGLCRRRAARLRRRWSATIEFVRRGDRRRGAVPLRARTPSCAGATRCSAASSSRSAWPAASAPLTLYFGAVPTYSMVYGAFATLPIFLVWIYLSWVIVLLGAVIAAYAPLVGKRMARWPDAPGARFHLALVVLGKLAEAREADGAAIAAGELAEAIGIDPLQVDRCSSAGRASTGSAASTRPGDARYVLLVRSGDDDWPSRWSPSCCSIRRPTSRRSGSAPASASCAWPRSSALRLRAPRGGCGRRGATAQERKPAMRGLCPSPRRRRRRA